LATLAVAPEFKINKLAVVVVRYPFDKVNVPVTVLLVLLVPSFSVTLAALFIVRPAKVVAAVPPIVCTALPLKLMVLDAPVKVAPLFVQLPLILCVKAPPLKAVPAPKTIFPPIVRPATAVVLAVPARVKFPPIEVVPVCNVFAPLPLNVRL